jgi:hypothetical protein
VVCHCRGSATDNFGRCPQIPYTLNIRGLGKFLLRVLSFRGFLQILCPKYLKQPAERPFQGSFSGLSSLSI